MTTSPSKPGHVVKAALTYTKSGLSVVPTGKDKIPLNSWKPMQIAIPSGESVKIDFSKPGTCVALVAGKVSGNLEMLDFDFEGTFFDAWKELVEKEFPGLIERLIKQKTQNGGCHIAYRCPDTEIPGNMKLASECIEVPNQGDHEFKGKAFKAISRNGKYFIAPTFIETRGEGGYFLAYPSPGYLIEQNRFSQIPNISKEEREILIESAKALNKWVPEQTTSTKPTKTKYLDQKTPGDDFEQRGDVESVLKNHGWTNTGRTATVNGDPGEHWRRPGKERGQSATLINGKRLFVFSTNAAPFESDRVYTPFAIYAMLNNGGSFSAAAKELYRQGYGSKPEPELKPAAIKKPTSSLFPYQVMTGAAGYFANVYGSVIEAPEHFLFMAYLTCLGAVLSKRLTIKSELQTQPRLYVALVGESATDRKSTTLKIADNHFRSVVDQFSSCWGVGSAEGLQKMMKKNQEDDLPGTILILDELKSFVNKCKIESSILLPTVNTLFESNRFESHTKNKSIEIENAHLCILAASTLNTYERIYTPAFIDIGFPNRVFLVTGTAKRQFSFPEKVDQSDTDVMKSNLREVLRHAGNCPEFNITAEAKEMFHKWYLNLESSVHARRLDGYALRFMILLAANNMKDEIDVETVNHAIALCDWQLEIRKMHDPVDADSEIAKMEERIRRALNQGPLKDRELKQKTGAYRSGLWVYNSALKNLQKGQEIGWDKKNKQWFWAEI
jgi:hypothetical protein